MKKKVQKSYHFYVAGVQHHDLHTIDPNYFQSVSKLLLVPEPTNKFDKNAVKVTTTTGTMLGYVPAKHSKEIFDFISAGLSVNCELVAYHPNAKPWQQLLVNIWIDDEIEVND